MTIWWNAVTGGAFFTRWSAALSLLVAGVFSVPSIGGTGLESYLRGALVATLGWVPLAVLVLPAVLAERRLRARPARAVVVLGSLALAAIARSGINDAISALLFDIVPHGSALARVATNLVTAFALLSIVAMITSRHAAARAAAERLRAARERVEVAGAARDAFARASDRELRRAGARLRASRERMLAGTVDFDGVRAFADEVRDVSHGLDRRLRAEPDAASVPPGPPVPVESPPLSHRLVPTPWLVTGPLYAIACLPFAVAAGGIGVALGGILAGIAVDLAAGVATRRWARPPGRGATFALVWLAAGIAMAGATYVLLPGIGTLGLVPVPAVPVVAVLVSLCRDALARAHADERAAAAGLAEVARQAALADRRLHEPLRRAIEALHGRAQGACVVFGAIVDEHDPAPDDLARFRARTDAAFDELTSPVLAPAVSGRAALEHLLEVWRPVIRVESRVSAAATAMLDTHAAADGIASVVNEALVNAVKHSGARRAAIDLDRTPAGDLRLRVAAPGRLAAVSRRGLGTAAARVYQDGGDVVLEAVVAVASLSPRAATAG
ncbi:ATPase [Microbacterium oleivorans]|uniref:ATPase n=1 Tax=Microbacterium oleivorans TaxID=273677 RepID=A0A7D5EST8_9MICO|nr:ATPase [Microbacterium oleivorans]QLD12305.1 ATPase [Microbacterium oleivorans]